MCPRCRKTPDQMLETVGHLQNPRCKPFRKTPDQEQVACDSFWEEGLCTKGIDRGTNGGSRSVGVGRGRVRVTLVGAARRSAGESRRRWRPSWNPRVRRVALDAVVGGDLPDTRWCPADAHPGGPGLGRDQVLALQCCGDGFDAEVRVAVRGADERECFARPDVQVVAVSAADGPFLAVSGVVGELATVVEEVADGLAHSPDDLVLWVEP